VIDKSASANHYPAIKFSENMPRPLTNNRKLDKIYKEEKEYQQYLTKALHLSI